MTSRLSHGLLAIGLTLAPIADGGGYRGRVITDAFSGRAGGRVVCEVPTDQKAIAIDDGPDARETPLILDVLATHEARGPPSSWMR